LDGARYATENHKTPEVWLRQVERDGRGQNVHEKIDPVTAQREALLMGLRLTQGIEEKAWLEKFGTPLTSFLNPQKVARLEQEKLVMRAGGVFRTTPTGLERLNAVLGYLV
jgi:oxygen-independent coproporphyrinogen-3 oxidase